MPRLLAYPYIIDDPIQLNDELDGKLNENPIIHEPAVLL
jgi:hypothetical protein